MDLPLGYWYHPQFGKWHISARPGERPGKLWVRATKDEYEHRTPPASVTTGSCSRGTRDPQTRGDCRV
jgi:hypothetical protein